MKRINNLLESVTREWLSRSASSSPAARSAGVDPSLEHTITGRFEAIARQFPSRPAVQDNVATVTYAELKVRANRIAAATILATRGALGPVAILLPASASLPAAMLGILAAGRAYVALDPDFPCQRNTLIISESGACAVVSNLGLFKEARKHLPRDLPFIDIDALPELPEVKSEIVASPDDLSAIYYTSGSTGVPKGVAWTHRNLLHWIQVFTETAQISCVDRMALLFSPSVSASYRSIYCSLLNGASLHVLPPLDLGLPVLLEQIRTRGITIYHSVPSLLDRIAESVGDHLHTVRLVCIGGDRVQWSDVDACRRIFSPDVRVYSVLTSTEAGPFIHGFIGDTPGDTATHPPVGRPAPGWAVTIVSEKGKSVPIGESGEIVLTSRFIALGYWRNCQVYSFAADPADPGIRTYRTGDLAVQRPDGTIEYVGRQDQQIKLRGHRIEIGEVENALKCCGGVHDAAVVVRRNQSGIARSLAAYCELEPAATGVLPIHLRSMLSEILPLHMLPGSITILDALSPTTRAS